MYGDFGGGLLVLKKKGTANAWTFTGQLRGRDE